MADPHTDVQATHSFDELFTSPTLGPNSPTPTKSKQINCNHTPARLDANWPWY